MERRNFLGMGIGSALGLGPNYYQWGLQQLMGNPFGIVTHPSQMAAVSLQYDRSCPVCKAELDIDTGKTCCSCGASLK